jgi:hypothetical protein
MLHVSDKLENMKERFKDLKKERKTDRKEESFELFYFIILINEIK